MNSKYCNYPCRIIPIILCIVGIFGIFPVLAPAQKAVIESVNPWQFAHLTEADGLASKFVTDICQDDAGFWWLATDNGLQRFDGKHFVTFLHDPEDPGSLPADRVNALFFDEKKRLWIATSGGMCRYNPVSGRFDQTQANGKPVSAGFPSRFLYDGQGGFWFGTTAVNGLYRYLPEADAWENVPVSDNELMYGNLCADKQSGDLWFLFKTGVGVLERASGTVKHTALHPNAHPVFKRIGLPRVVCTDSRNNLWFLHKPNGPHHNELLRVQARNSPVVALPGEIKGNRIRLLEDRRRRVWFFSDFWPEFGYFDSQTGTKHQFYCVPDVKNNPEMEMEGLNAVFEDREGNFWLATSTGVYTFHPDRQVFHAVQGLLDPQQKVTPLRTTISFFESARQEIWMGTYFGGSVVFSSELQLRRQYANPPSPPGTEDLESNDNYNCVWAFQEDRQGRIWAGGQLGTLQLFSPEGRLLQRWRMDSPYRTTIRTLMRGSGSDTLFLAAHRGLVGAIPPDGRVSFFKPETEHLMTLPGLPDSDSLIWMRFKNSIARFNCREGRFDLYAQPPGEVNPIMDISYWDDTTLLVCGSSLFLFDKNRRSFKRLSLPVRNATRAIRDAAGVVWLCSRQGFARWNPANNQIVWYNRNDGLPETDFGMQRAACQLKDGRILISTGKFGFFWFHPDSIAALPHPPDVVILGARAPGRTIRVHGPHRQLEFAHDDNFITVDYACLTWLQQPGLRFRYRLLGQSEEWIDNGAERRVSLNGIAPGNYTLQIQAINREGLASRNITAFRIRVRPPWWAGAWALACYTALLALGSWILYRRLLRRKLEQAEIRKIRELEAFKSRFFANITHEFRTPLTILSGAADLIAQNPREELEKGLGIIRANTRRMLQLVNQLLDLAKLESGFLPLHIQRADLAGFLRYLAECYQSLATTRAISLQFESSVPELQLDFDEERLRQILDNLLSNALKFTPAGGRVTVLLDRPDDPPRARIRVQDTGSGIEEDKLPLIFDRFYQADTPAARTGEGTGIGLALARELARSMNGDLFAANAAGQGAIFTLEFPLPPRENAEMDVRQASLPPARPAGQRPEVLVVEDNPDIVRYLIAILSPTYDVQAASDGAAGLREALARVPDLIISDVMMPGMDGFALTAALKTDIRTSHIPVILLTAKAGLDNKLQGLERGADAYLEKPFVKEELLAVARQMVQSRILLRQHYMASVGLAEPPAAAVPPRLSEQENAFLRAAVAAVENRISDPAYSVEQLCADLLMSHSNLHRKLKAVADLSPTLFIRQIRLQRAKALLLEQPEMPVYAVADACGFEDSAYFIRVFRQEFDTTPANWRASHT